MAATQAEKNRWAASLASRLKLLQAGCADEPAVKRRQALAEEIKRAINDLSLGERKAHLEALSQYFPAWGMASAPVEREREGEPVSAAELVEKLVERLRASSDGERQQVAAALMKAGLVVVQPASVWLASEDLQRVLGVVQGQRVDPERMARLLGMLAETMDVLDKFAWGKWAQWAPSSTFRKPAGETGNPRSLMRSYLTEPNPQLAENGLAQLNELLGKDDGMTTKLAVELLVAVERAGLEYGRMQLEQLSPDSIASVVTGSGIFGNIEAARWKKYVEMSRHYSTREAIAKKIRDCVVKVVERNRPQRD